MQDSETKHAIRLTNCTNRMIRSIEKFATKLYPYVPIWVQQLMVSVYGLKWHKRRFGGIFQQELTQYKNREQFSVQEWEAYCNNQLRSLLLHAFQTVPYYQQLWTDIGFDSRSIATFTTKQLGQLPMLEKETLRQEGDSSLLSLKLEASGEFYASSGSTGTPTRILFSAKMHQRWSAAFEARIRNWAGLSIKNPRGMIGGRRIVNDGNNQGPFYRYNFIEKQVYFSAYHISPQHIPNYLKGMQQHRIDYMTGYAMSNYFLARFMEEQNIQAPQLKAVITSSEKLTPEMRNTFKRVYGCKSYDSYSGVEACGLISECEHGSLHISPDVAIIEIIKEDGSYAQPGETGEAVCTGFLNYDQPLIRYRIGDLLKLSANQQCTCGRQMPVVDEIIGRIEDTVVGLDGREMVRFHGIFINMPSVIEGQIIQHTLTAFEIVVVASAQLTETEKSDLKNRMESQLGAITLTVTETTHIPRNQNGKFKAVVSHVNRK